MTPDDMTAGDLPLGDVPSGDRAADADRRPRSGLAAVSGLLACPVCGAALAMDAARLACASGHSFDIARQGHVNLLGRAAPANADTAGMVAARERFLGGGWYDPIAAALARRLRLSRRVLDAGGGSGFYLSRVLDAAPDAVGLLTDVSPYAARRAARAHPRLGAVVADTWAGLPVRASSVDAVMCVFAPRNPSEFARVLRQGGLLAVVTPNPGHLASARVGLGLLGLESDKLAKVQRSLAGAFEPVISERITAPLDLDADAARDLVAMGPNAFHEHGEVTGGLHTDLDVQLSLFRRPIQRG